MKKVFYKVYAVVGVINAITLGGLQPVADTLWVANKVAGLFEKKETNEINTEYEIKDA